MAEFIIIADSGEVVNLDYGCSKSQASEKLGCEAVTSKC